MRADRAGGPSALTSATVEHDEKDDEIAAEDRAPDDKPAVSATAVPVRCGWAGSAPDYLEYHDREWGRPVHGSDALFERLSLEAFQAGLSWITILGKRPAFRRAFAGFVITEVAAFDQADVDRLMADPAIVRNRAKIAAVVSNAHCVLEQRVDLDELLWSFAPPHPGPRPSTTRAVPSTTVQSVAMAKELRRRGIKFIGPRTAYALMQATGMVNDHVADCFLA